MTDSVGTSHYDYDIQDRLASYTPPLPSNHAPVEYTYNALGQKTSVTNGSMVVNYGYYANGWLKTVTDGAQQPLTYAAYSYDPAGNRTQVDLSKPYGGNCAGYTVYDYDADPRYRVDAVKHYKKGSPDTLLAQMAYYDPENPGDLTKYRDGAGNPRAMKDWNPLVAYGYDANSRLVSAETTYAYDWVGNRNPSTFTYNAADQLVASPGHVYEYWGTGSLQYQEDENTVIEKRYEYTPANLLESVTHADVSGVPVSSMTWDADGNRVSFTSSTGGTWSFVYDTTAGIPAVIEEVLPSTSSVYYIREPNGALIARVAGETVNYYHFDALGSARLLTDADGEVTDTYTYDAWGNLVSHTGTTAQPYQFVGQLGYYTHTQDANFPLLQLGVRFYHPGTGRFTQRDPVDSLTSAYMYCNDNCTSFVDPTGETCYRCWRELETLFGLGGQWHAFIWCDSKGNGYDEGDGVIGLQGNGMCSDYDRKFMRNKSLGESYDLNCRALSDALTECIERRMSTDMNRRCFGKFNAATNNCQAYAQDIIDDCKCGS